MGPAYVWELDNGYGFIVIDLFSHYKNMYGEKYEILVRNPKGNYIEERSNIHTSSLTEIEEKMKLTEEL